jgi:hypothetical protein
LLRQLGLIGLFRVARLVSGFLRSFVLAILRGRSSWRLLRRRRRKKLMREQEHTQRKQHETNKSSLIQRYNLYWRESGQFSQFVIR